MEAYRVNLVIFSVKRPCIKGENWHKDNNK